MKEIIFKKQMFLLFLLFIGIPIHAQEDNLRFHSASFGVGVIDTPSESSEDGFNVVGDIATQWRKNLFSLYVNQGSGFFVGTFGSDDSEDFLEVNLTYGREIELLSWIKLEGHAGIGFFNHQVRSERESIDLNKTSVGFPLRAKLIFFYKFLGVGINQNVNFNPLVSTRSTDLILQVIF